MFEIDKNELTMLRRLASYGEVPSATTAHAGRRLLDKGLIYRDRRRGHYGLTNLGGLELRRRGIKTKDYRK